MCSCGSQNVGIFFFLGGGRDVEKQAEYLKLGIALGNCRTLFFGSGVFMVRETWLCPRGILGVPEGLSQFSAAAPSSPREHSGNRDGGTSFCSRLRWLGRWWHVEKHAVSRIIQSWRCEWGAHLGPGFSVTPCVTLVLMSLSLSFLIC